MQVLKRRESLDVGALEVGELTEELDPFLRALQVSVDRVPQTL